MPAKLTEALSPYSPAILEHNSFQKWLRILIWLIIPMDFQNLLPVSYLSAITAKVIARQ